MLFFSLVRGLTPHTPKSPQKINVINTSLALATFLKKEDYMINMINVFPVCSIFLKMCSKQGKC